jgi:hypothetical protein
MQQLARCNRESSLSRWYLLRFALWHCNGFRLTYRLVHWKLKGFHDDRSQRFPDLHVCFPSSSLQFVRRLQV